MHLFLIVAGCSEFMFLGACVGTCSGRQLSYMWISLIPLRLVFTLGWGRSEAAFPEGLL